MGGNLRVHEEISSNQSKPTSLNCRLYHKSFSKESPSWWASEFWILVNKFLSFQELLQPSGKNHQRPNHGGTRCSDWCPCCSKYEENNENSSEWVHVAIVAIKVIKDKPYFQHAIIFRKT